MNAVDWLERNVSRFKPMLSGESPAAAPRSTRERLEATLRQKDEAMSPRVLRRTLIELKAVIDPAVSEVEGGRRAKLMQDAWVAATEGERRDICLLMSEIFVADADKAKTAQAQFAAALGTPDEAVAEVNYRRATVSPRRRLLQRFSVYPEGIPFLVGMRAEMQPWLKADKRLRALDVEMEYMFSTWFDVGFLDLRRISWDSPASLVEKLIKYEAVHDIRSWSDVKNRLESDRRCYGFFHPRLPGEPLIFVEVALVYDMAGSITPLLDEAAEAVDLERANTAIFYSISNTQTGLRGVSFGDSLIKRVVETLKEEFPKLKVFATLSPIPGFRNWLTKNIESHLARLDDKSMAELKLALAAAGAMSPGTATAARAAARPAMQSAAALAAAAAALPAPSSADVLAALDKPLDLTENSPLRQLLLSAAAQYLGREMQDNKPCDPVARFHLGNGARVERLNWAGDPSAKGVKQSYGLMVNYLYDLKRLDKHRAMLAQGKVAVSGDIEELFLKKKS